jgi:hypothetical protein
MIKLKIAGRQSNDILITGYIFEFVDGECYINIYVSHTAFLSVCQDDVHLRRNVLVPRRMYFRAVF